MSKRKRHLTPGWCWRADVDGEPAVWGIYGHFTDEAARDIARQYEGDDVPDDAKVSRVWQRNVPCRPAFAAVCACGGECCGTRLENANGPGRGASPYTFVEMEAP